MGQLNKIKLIVINNVCRVNLFNKLIQNFSELILSISVIQNTNNGRKAFSLYLILY